MNNDTELPAFIFGFINGLWIAVGIDPTAEIFRILGELTENISGIPFVRFLFIVLPLLVTAITIYKIYNDKRLLGIIILIIGFIAGILILINPYISVFLMVAGIIVERLMFYN